MLETIMTNRLAWGLLTAAAILGGAILLILKAAAAFHAFAGHGGGL